MATSPAQQMLAHPMPEFRDVDHYRNPVGIVEGSHEIVRPKPRRYLQTLVMCYLLVDIIV